MKLVKNYWGNIRVFILGSLIGFFASIGTYLNHSNEFWEKFFEGYFCYPLIAILSLIFLIRGLMNIVKNIKLNSKNEIIIYYYFGIQKKCESNAIVLFKESDFSEGFHIELYAPKLIMFCILNVEDNKGLISHLQSVVIDGKGLSHPDNMQK